MTDNNACDNSWENVGDKTSVRIGPLAYESTYYWQVRALNANGFVSGDSGQWWSFSTMGQPPDPFAKIGPLDQSSGSDSLYLEWEPSGHFENYYVCFDTNDNNQCDAHWINVGNQTSYQPEDLALGFTYYWQVRAESERYSTDAD